jgi:hypothetical protein
LTISRPQICFVSWGPVPEDADVPLRIGQTGFHLANDGIAAHEISIEEFEIEPGVWAASATIARIREKGNGFALVWRKGFPSSALNIEKWDLPGCMAAAAARKARSEIFPIDYVVTIVATYRDGVGAWYRSHADLIYIPSQGRLKFGPTVHGIRKAPSEPQAAFEPVPGLPARDSRKPTAEDVSADAISATPIEYSNFTSEAEEITAVVTSTADLLSAQDVCMKLDRRAAVDSYIETVLKQTGKRITRTEIWKAAGYKTRTDFERWERGDPKATRASHRAFTRILAKPPQAE